VKAPSTSADTTAAFVWQIPQEVLPAPTLDLYLNGGFRQAMTATPIVGSGINTYEGYVFGLTANTTYQATLVAKSSAGSSAARTPITFTTGPPPKTRYTVEVSGSCGSGDCYISHSNATGGDDTLSSASGGSRSIEVPKGGSGSYSVFVYDNTYATSTTCTFTVDEFVKKPATSNDGGSASC
jgi:hypothetical protein